MLNFTCCIIWAPDAVWIPENIGGAVHISSLIASNPKSSPSWWIDSVLSQVIARDIISLLSPHLCPCENAVLDGLADGLGVREIGRRLGISHTMVVRHRSKIASLLLKLEGPSFPREQFRGASAAEDRKQANGVLRTDPAKRVNGAKWSDGLKQNNDTNGATRPSIVPAEAIPSTRCNGFLKLARNQDPTTNSSRMAA